MRRQATKLVPGDHISGGFRGDFFRAVTGQNLVCEVAETDAMPVTEETNVRRQMTADFGQRFVAADGCDAIRSGIERLLQISSAAFPRGDFQTGAEFWFNFVKRVGEQTRQQVRAGGAFDELTGAHQQSQHHAHQRRAGQVAGRDVDQQARPRR